MKLLKMSEGIEIILATITRSNQITEYVHVLLHVWRYIRRSPGRCRVIFWNVSNYKNLFYLLVVFKSEEPMPRKMCFYNIE